MTIFCWTLVNREKPNPQARPRFGNGSAAHEKALEKLARAGSARRPGVNTITRKPRTNRTGPHSQ